MREDLSPNLALTGLICPARLTICISALADLFVYSFAVDYPRVNPFGGVAR